MDAISYAWQKWVLNYDATLQYSVLRDLLGEVTPTRWLMLLLIPGVCVMGFVAWSLFGLRGEKHPDPAVRSYQDFCYALNRKGLTRELYEAPGDFADRVARECPAIAEQVYDITRLLERLIYEPEGSDSHNEQLALMDQRIRSAKKSIAGLPKLA